MERLAGVQVKDCFIVDETVHFVVAPGQMGKAIGKGGSTIKRIEQEFNKKIRVIEFNENLADFVRNIIAPLTVEEIVQEGNQVIIKDQHKKTKSLLIGRGGKNLILLNRAVQRFFNVEEVKVI